MSSLIPSNAESYLGAGGREPPDAMSLYNAETSLLYLLNVSALGFVPMLVLSGFPSIKKIY